MSSTILIRGATGFIGRAILIELLNQKKNVIVLLHEDSKVEKLKNISNYNAIYYKNIDDPIFIKKLKKLNIGIIIDCAWEGVAGIYRNKEFQLPKNKILTFGLLNIAILLGVKQWISFGSQAEYGNQNKKLDELAELKPTTLYGKAKKQVGLEAISLCDQNNISGVWLRIFSTYGPNEPSHWFITYLIKEFFEKRSPKLTKCEQMWDYLYIEDMAKAVCSVANGKIKGTFNLGYGKAYQLKTIVELVKKKINSNLEPIYGAIDYREDQVMHLEADINKLKNLTGWMPIVNLEEGIQKTVEYFEKHPIYKI